MADIPSITIPDNKGEIGMTPEVKDRFNKIDNILIAVVASVLVSSIAVIVSMIGIFLDQMRYNNAAYKEYSEKIDTLNSEKKIYDEILKQNKDNQELILKNESEILKLLNNKSIGENITNK